MNGFHSRSTPDRDPSHNLPAGCSLSCRLLCVALEVGGVEVVGEGGSGERG